MQRAKNIFLSSIIIVWATAIPAQYFVTDRFAMNHWKFAGFAMYTKPSPSIFFNVHATDRELPLPELAQRIGQSELVRFQRLRELWGEFYAPDRLGARIFEAYPQYSRISVYVNTVVLDAASGMPRHRADQYRCDRQEKAIEQEMCVRVPNAVTRRSQH
jgi:hypothetical protein